MGDKGCSGYSWREEWINTNKSRNWLNFKFCSNIMVAPPYPLWNKLQATKRYINRSNSCFHSLVRIIVKRRSKHDTANSAMSSLTWVWYSSIGDNLCEQDAKGPDVWLHGERMIVGRFRRCPFDGEFGTDLTLIYVLLLKMKRGREKNREKMFE